MKFWAIQAFYPDFSPRFAVSLNLAVETKGSSCFSGGSNLQGVFMRFRRATLGRPWRRTSFLCFRGRRGRLRLWSRRRSKAAGLPSATNSSKSAHASSTPCAASKSPCPMPAPTRTCSSRPTTPSRQNISRNQPRHPGGGPLPVSENWHLCSLSAKAQADQSENIYNRRRPLYGEAKTGRYAPVRRMKKRW